MTGMPPKFRLSGFALVQPTIIDLIKVCRQLPDDERVQYQAFQGVAFVPDEAAVRFACMEGPRWALVDADGEPIIVGGFTWIREGVWQDWLLTTPAAWERHWRTVTKVCRRVMDQMLATEAHRLQCIALAGREGARRWYGALGYRHEGVLRQFGHNREDAVIYSRIDQQEVSHG